jgi:hypothetical protein
MSNSHYFRIPKPCHEDWDKMHPSEQGRHCDACSKVVLDLAGKDRAQVAAAIAATGAEGACTRIDSTMLNKPLEAYGVLQFSHQRLRMFALAFVLAFGLEALGVSKLEAQTAAPIVKDLSQSQNLKATINPRNAKEVVLSGLVLDVYTREPVFGAIVGAFDNGKQLANATTDEEGKFELRMQRKAIEGENYVLRLNYFGREREDREISILSNEILYLIDASREIEGVQITSKVVWEVDPPIIMGDTFTDVDHYLMGQTTCVITNPISNKGPLFRPLDEWLMMNFSEIHHSGRW